jgi:RNA polymerase sigma-70 factor (ECF subfamily)
MSPKPRTAETGPWQDGFATTRWSVVVSAGRRTSPQSEQALAELCQAYWYPLYAYVRRRGYRREEAEDLTQAFFERLLQKNDLQGLHRDQGKFRAFLLASLKHFLANEWNRSQRAKRGGGIIHLSLDWQSADERYKLDPPDTVSPDQLYDHAWAVALLERVLLRLHDECTAAGKAALFQRAKPFLMLGEETIPYREAGQDLGLDEGAMRVNVHRLRKHYRDLLHDELRQTLADPNMVAEELHSLRTALAPH